MTIFVDTSAFVALLDACDSNYELASLTFQELLELNHDLRTCNYTALETASVLQRKFGLKVVQDLFLNLLSSFEIDWITPELHERAVVTLLVSNRRDLSLVDCVSFELMRQKAIETAFTFDPHFVQWGFEVLPARNSSGAS